MLVQGAALPPGGLDDPSDPAEIGCLSSKPNGDQVEAARAGSHPAGGLAKGLGLAVGVCIDRIGLYSGLDLDGNQAIRPAHEQIDLPPPASNIAGDDDGTPLPQEASSQGLAQSSDVLVG